MRGIFFILAVSHNLGEKWAIELFKDRIEFGFD